MDSTADLLQRIIFRAFKHHFAPDGALRMPETATLLDKWNPCMVFPLAYAYVTEHEDNVLFDQPIALEAMDLIRAKILETGGVRRQSYPLVHAFAAIRDKLPAGARKQWKQDIVKLISEKVFPEVQQRERLTVLSSANVGTGTNHLAMEFSGLVAYATTFRNDPDFEQMNPGGEQLIQYVTDYLARFMNYMHDDGYWSECDGPVIGYNCLTAHATYVSARDLGLVETYRSHFEKTARFHCITTLCNLEGAKIVDGRQRDREVKMHSPATLLFLPEGRTLFNKAIEVAEKEWKANPAALSGEILNYLLAAINAAEDQVDDLAPHTWETGDCDRVLSDNFAFVRRGGWIAGVSNQQFTPRPEGHWNLDYTTLFMLYHDAVGSVLLGLNSKNDPLHATFHHKYTKFDGYDLPPHAPLWQCLPGEGHFTIADGGVSVMRDYRGFEGLLDFKVIDDMTAELHLNANINLDDYPVGATLLPAIDFGSSFKDGCGRSHTITEEPFALSGADLGGCIVLEPQESPNVFRDAGRRPVSLHIPDDAVLRWPHGAWDPYNLVTDRYVPIKGKSVLLEIPVGPSGAVVRFALGDQIC